MILARSHIHFETDDLVRSSAFYEALLGAAPSRRDADVAVFELNAPPLVLTLQRRPPAQRARRQAGRDARPTSASEDAKDPFGAGPGFALVVSEPQQVGRAAISLRRAGVQLRLRDAGIEASDPDGNAWQVRFTPAANGRVIVTTEKERGP